MYVPYEPKVWTVRYSIESAPEGRVDGSGQVALDIWSEVSSDSGETWSQDKHYNPMLPGADLETALQLGTTGAQATAVKGLVVTHRASPAEPVTGDSIEEVNLRQNNNGVSASAAVGFGTLLVTLKPTNTYPFKFTL